MASAKRRTAEVAVQRGRPTDLTPERQARICALIREGLRFKQAAEGAGIKYSTFAGWRHKGRQGIEPYATFAEAVKDAERDYELSVLVCIRAAASDPKTWTAGAWLLQRRYPDRYHQPIKEYELRAVEAAARRQAAAPGEPDPAALARYLVDFYPDVLKAALSDKAKPKADHDPGDLQ